jgi:DNA-binding transcriptional MerR regulator
MYNIGKLASLSGVLAVTIRYYEKVGLMERPKRQDNGYRLYSEEDLARLSFIRHCRHHNLPIEAIKELLALNDSPATSCGAVNDIIDRQIERLEELGRSINDLKNHLAGLRERCSGLGTVAQCGIMKGLMDQDPACPCPEDGAGEGIPRIIWPEQDERSRKRAKK